MAHRHADDEKPSRTGAVDRRSVLALTGAAATGALLGTGVVGAALDDYANVVVVDGRGTDTPTTYQFDVAQRVARIAEIDNANDTVDGTHVEGSVDGTVNAYEFDSEIVRLSVDGPADVAFGSDAASLVPETASTLTVRSPSHVVYEFTATGQITKRLDDGDVSAERGNDSVTRNADGTWTATGSTGNGYGDSYDVDGEVTAWTASTSDYSLTRDGVAVSAAELTGEGSSTDDGSTATTYQTFTITSPSSVNYSYTATDEVRKRLDDGSLSAEPGNDTVTANDDGSYDVSGSTGNGYGDSYDVAGAITSFTTDTTDYTITFGGEELTATELTGDESSGYTGDDSTSGDTTDGSTDSGTSVSGELGGGDGYSATVAQSAADYTASSAGGLADALSSAGTGDVVYLTDDVSVGSTLVVPDGVTLASDRGIDGAAGSTIVADSEFIVMEAGADSRITGLRMDGPMTGYEDWDGYPAGAGIECRGSGIEIDNCELFGFAYAAVEASNDEHVHHCDIHDNPQDGLGYGVTCTGGHPIIEYNTFDANRHSVAGSGSGGYTVRYNHFGTETVDHVIDMHEPGGTNLVIHHNTVEAVDHMQDGGETEAVYIRDEVSDGATIENNWFYHPSEPSAGGDAGEAVRTPFGSWGAANVSLAGNAYGSSEPDASVGAPR